MTFQGSIEDKADQAQRLLASIVPGAFCTAQAWNDRIDCAVRLPDGSIAGEMIRLAELSEPRILATATACAKHCRAFPCNW